MEMLATVKGKTQVTPGSAPETVRQEEGSGVLGEGTGSLGQSAESEISWLIHSRKTVTRAMTEGAPLLHPLIPQDTTPTVS